MFTGIIEETGILLSVKGGSSGSRLVIGADRILEDIKRGDSIAVNGVCLTAASFDSGCFCLLYTSFPLPSGNGRPGCLHNRILPPVR